MEFSLGEKNSETSAGLTISDLMAGFQGAKSIEGLDNQAAVFSSLVPQIPGAIGDAISDDWKNHKGELATKVLVSTGLGIGSAVLLARSPGFSRALMGMAGLSGGVYALGHTVDFAGSAWKAGSDEERQGLVDAAKRSIGRVGADLIETAPGFIGGTKIGVGLTRRFPMLDATALSVRNSVELPLAEKVQFLGKDAKTLRSVAGERAGLDLLKTSDEMAGLHPWKSVEEARLFKPAGDSSVKLGATLRGTADDVHLGGRFNNVFHTHQSRILPTSGDFTAVKGTGVIAVQEEGLLTFYNGFGKQATAAEMLAVRGSENARAAMTALEQETFSSLVVDKSRGLAVRVDSVWVDKLGLRPKSVQPVNFEEAVGRLRNWDGKAIDFGRLGPAPTELLKDGMTNFLRRLSFDS